MEVQGRTAVRQEGYDEDGEIVYFFVWWVSVISVATRDEWHHAYTFRSYQDVEPDEFNDLYARVVAAVDKGMGADHFNTSPHWSWSRHETLEERWTPYGSEWQLEQKERQAGMR